MCDTTRVMGDLTLELKYWAWDGKHQFVLFHDYVLVLKGEVGQLLPKVM